MCFNAFFTKLARFVAPTFSLTDTASTTVGCFPNDRLCVQFVDNLNIYVCGGCEVTRTPPGSGGFGCLATQVRCTRNPRVQGGGFGSTSPGLSVPGLMWADLVWLGLAWSRLTWSAWSGLNWSGWAWLGLG